MIINFLIIIQGNMLMGLIKFSDERNKWFSIKTIVDTHGQSAKVRKESIYKEGWQHINNIYDNQKGLKEYFPNVNICNAHLKGEGVIEFDYLEGISLEDEYICAVLEEDVGRFEKLLSKHREIIIGGDNNHCLFSDSEKFNIWFGSGDNYVGKEALKYANFDAIPSNIIYVNSQPYFIDYEWVMRFEMPLDLVIYNCIDNLYMKNKIVRHFYPEERALAFMGVNTDIEILKESYWHFFDYIICDDKGKSYAKDKITCLKPKNTIAYVQDEWKKCADEWKSAAALVAQKDEELATANREWQKCADEWKNAVALVTQKEEELATANREWKKCADEWKNAVQIIQDRDEELIKKENEKNEYKEKYEAVINSKGWKAITKVRNIVKTGKRER